MDSDVIPKHIRIFLIIMCCFSEKILSDVGKPSSQSNSQNQIESTLHSMFITKNSTKVMAQKGGVAILPCAVKINSPETVSWIRRKDFQLLTVGLSTHSIDGRFLVEHARHMGHWSLRIKSVREDDQGLYECQLSIYPTQSIFIELNIVEAVAEIIGAPDLHIDEGSALRLQCRIKSATENPSFVFWYHNDKMVNYDSQDGFSVTSNNENNNNNNMPIINMNHRHHKGDNGINGGNGGRHRSKSRNRRNITQISGSLEYNNFTNSFLLESQILKTPSTSILTIDKVHFNHAGNYTCAPSNTKQGSIHVHVLRGEKPAAMQHANRSIVIEEVSKSKATTIRWHFFKHYHHHDLILFLSNLVKPKSFITINYKSILLFVIIISMLYNNINR